MKLGREVGILMLGIGAASVTLGAGFQNPPDGAAALATVQYRVAEAADASTVGLNPANLADLSEGIVTPTVTIGYQKKKYSSPVFGNEESEQPWRMLPGIFGAMPLRKDVAIGVGVYMPYSQATHWPEDGLFKGRAPFKAEIRTFDLTPAVATKFGGFRLGVGLDLIWSDVDFQQDFIWMPGNPLSPASRIGLDGDGYGLGAHAGITWVISDMQRVAVACRSPVDIEYEGGFSMENPPPVGLPPGLSPNSSFNTEIHFPTVLSVGYSVRPSEQLCLSAGAEWVEHSRNERLVLDIGGNTPFLSQILGDTSIPQNWKNRWTLALGAEWMYTVNWRLRGGWTFIPTPIPDETVSPTTVEGDQHLLMLGVGYHSGVHRLDMAYACGFMDKRTVPNPVAQGVTDTWEFESQLFSVSYTYMFR